MMDSEVRIDGSKGEGGGQMLRTSLSLSAAYGKAPHLAFAERRLRQAF